MRGFIDEFGVEHHPPAPVRPYSARPAPIVRTVLGVTIAGMSLVLFQLGSRAADSDPEHSSSKVWLDYFDVWSQRFDRTVAPAVARVRNGDETAAGAMFFGGDPFVASEFEIGLEEWGNIADTPEERIEANVELERFVYSRHDDPIFELMIDWNRSALAAVEWDGSRTRVDPAAIAALDTDEFRQRLIDAEAVARAGKRVDHAYTKFRHRLRWIQVVVLAVLIVAAAITFVWVRRAAFRAMRQELQRYDDERRAFANLREAIPNK